MSALSPGLRIFAAVALAGLVAACQTPRNDAGGGGNGAANSDAAYDLTLRLATAIGTCWFSASETDFADYVYSPERNAGVSRILVVTKSDPTGLPALVIEATGGASVDIYGPLATSPAAPRIRADVGRWIGGSTACA